MTSSELTPQKKRRVDAGTVTLAVAALVAIGGLAFAVGRLTAPAAAASASGLRGGFGGVASGSGTSGSAAGNGQTATGSFAPGAGAFRGGFGGATLGTEGGLTISGTVTAVSSSSITLKLASGSTIDIPIDSSTAYHSQAAATASDVKVGGQVAVELAGFGAGTGARDFSGRPAASAAPGAGTGSTGSGGAPAAGAAASPNPGDLLARLGAARSITVVSP